MNKYELEAKLKNGMEVVVFFEVDGYKPLVDMVEDLNGNELNESQYDADEVYQIACDEALDMMVGNV